MSIKTKCKERGITVFGEPEKGSKASESEHMITFFNVVRDLYPDIGRIAIHVRNEGKRTFNQVAQHKAEGLVAGASDIIIPGNPSFVCELKNLSSRAKITDDQLYYLEAAQKNGSFVCVAMGWAAAIEALEKWIKKLD